MLGKCSTTELYPWLEGGRGGEGEQISEKELDPELGM